MVTEQAVSDLEWLYALPKSPECDATWKRKTGVAQLLNQFRDQADSAAALRASGGPARQRPGQPGSGAGPSNFDSV